MICKICECESKPSYRAVILNKYDIQYYSCSNCHFVQAEEPYWLEESYNEAISTSDTGIMVRNLHFVQLTSVLLTFMGKSKSKCLDFGGGYGIFVRLMRDIGFNFFWFDKYASNQLARGFEGSFELTKYGAITSFENFEHLENPLFEIEQILSKTDCLIFSTHLIPSNHPTPQEWWYYCLEHGQHISLFSRESLDIIAKKYNFQLLSDNYSFHVFSKRLMPSWIIALAKVFVRFGFSRFFQQRPFTVSDMNKMIENKRIINE